MQATLQGKTYLITGGARRIGAAIGLGIAQAGGNVIVHYGRSATQAEKTCADIRALGSQAWMVQADLNDPLATRALIARAWECSPLDGLINNASIFAPSEWQDTSLEAWERHMRVNLTAPFLLSQAFARRLPASAEGRIVNLLDWRALRPGADHLPYTISKAGLAALTRALAAAFGEHITVNGVALGAILPPADGGDTQSILENVPAGRWAALTEVQQTVLFLLAGPAYIRGEIIHLDGGRHLI